MPLRPLPFEWNGEAMIPSERFRALAKRQFVKGRSYVLEPHDPVTHKERGFYFASIKEAHDNLSPEAVANYPTPEDLRKWALIKAGWRHENFTVCESADQAAMLAAFLRKLPGHKIIDLRDNVVRLYLARSQKIGDPDDGYMTQEEWKKSKQDVLDVLSQTIGVTRRELEKQEKS